MKILKEALETLETQVLSPRNIILIGFILSVQLSHRTVLFKPHLTNNFYAEWMKSL
jgi:hypothetical protein